MVPSWKALVQPGQVWELLKKTFTAWSDDTVPRHGAALAYYTVLSLVPLLVVIIAMIGLIFGREAAEGYILEQIGSQGGSYPDITPGHVRIGKHLEDKGE